ncbi:MAG: hypothetical protein ACRC8Y_19940 [Chroococcales cyanobacterium]
MRESIVTDRTLGLEGIDSGDHIPGLNDGIPCWRSRPRFGLGNLRLAIAPPVWMEESIVVIASLA